MKSGIGQVVVILVLLAGSAFCYVSAWGTWDLFYNYPGAGRQVAVYMTASGILLALAVWRVVALILRRRRGGAA